MRANFKILSLFLALTSLVMGCTKEEIDVAGLTNFPPGILSITPADNAKVVKGNFDVKVVFVDGTTSPLVEAAVSLAREDGTPIASAEKDLSGTMDSVVIAGSSFNAESLDVGIYKMTITVTDADGQTATRETTFEISNLPFAANHDEMFLAGAFNGWGADRMTLVSDHIWELTNVDFGGGTAWKIKNCADWCDEDWGDGDCDGFLTSNKADGGNSDTNCSHSGLVNIRFNDQTLSYSVQPAVTYAANVSGLYLLGTVNNFQGSEYQFALVADNTWVLDEVVLSPGDQYKFAEMPDFEGQNFGDAEGDGIAELYGPNIVVPNDQQEAFYSITFNDRTLAYEVEFLRFPSIGIIGSATPTGWDSDTDMTDNGDGTFSITMELIDGLVKFRANDSWDTNWGGTDFPSGVATLGGPDIPVVAGNYNITFNPGTGEYNFETDAGITSVGIIGSATSGGWDADTDMTNNGDGTFSLLIGLGTGEVKFRANDAWDVNWGGASFPAGVGTINGPNIPVLAGIYLVTFNVNTGDYSFTPVSIGIIGDATPGGWDADTDMTVNPDVIGEVTAELTLTAGQAKFRANDDWAINWGAEAFPTGVGTQNGPNIPITAGEYTIRFNVNTGAYSFE